MENQIKLLWQILTCADDVEDDIETLPDEKN